jgi:hypothetical protein
MNARFGYAAALQDFSPAYVGSGSWLCQNSSLGQTRPSKDLRSNVRFAPRKRTFVGCTAMWPGGSDLYSLSQPFANAAIATSRAGRSSRGHAYQLDWPVRSPLRASRVLFAKAAFQIVEREVIVDQEVF